MIMGANLELRKDIDQAEGLDRVCPACGTAAQRESSRFCATCGKRLEGSYLPADSLRASYHLHSAAFQSIEQTERMSYGIPGSNKNGAALTALAFATYALVPYLGILFCPGAVLSGCIGLIKSIYVPQIGGRRASVVSIVLGFIIFGFQVVLWWIIVKVPEWVGTQLL